MLGVCLYSSKDFNLHTRIFTYCSTQRHKTFKPRIADNNVGGKDIIKEGISGNDRNMCVAGFPSLPSPPLSHPFLSSFTCPFLPSSFLYFPSLLSHGLRIKSRALYSYAGALPLDYFPNSYIKHCFFFILLFSSSSSSF